MDDESCCHDPPLVVWLTAKYLQSNIGRLHPTSLVQQNLVSGVHNKLFFLLRSYESQIKSFESAIKSFEVQKSKKIWRLRGPEAVNFLYLYLRMYSNKLAYLQLITVLVYGSSPSKSHEQSYLNFK